MIDEFGDNEDSAFYESSGDAYRNDVLPRSKGTPPAQPAPVKLSSQDIVNIFSGRAPAASAPPQPVAPEPGKTVLSSRDIVNIFSGRMPTQEEPVAAPPKEKSLLDKVSGVVDTAISDVYGDNKPKEEQIDKAALAEYKIEQAEKAARIAATRASMGLGKDDAYATKLLTSAAGGLGAAVSSTLEWIGEQAGSDSLKKIGAAGSDFSAALTPEDQDLVQKVAGGVGSMLSFAVPGLGVAKGLRLLGMGVKGARSVASGVAATLESASVAQETYEKVMSETGNKQLANEQSWKAATINLPFTYFTNKLGVFGETGSAAKKIGTAFLMEGPVQEGGQNILTNVLGFKPAGEGYTEESLVGGLAGGGFKGGMIAVQKWYEKASPEQRDEIVQKIIDDGKTARREVFDAMMGDERTAKILTDAGITSAEDENFIKVAQVIGKFDRELSDFDNQEKRKATTRESKADVDEAFRDTASTGFGVGMGSSSEPVIKRSSVTVDEATKTLVPKSEAGPEFATVKNEKGEDVPATAPEDIVAFQQGFAPLAGTTIGTSPWANRFLTARQAQANMDLLQTGNELEAKLEAHRTKGGIFDKESLSKARTQLNDLRVKFGLERITKWKQPIQPMFPDLSTQEVQIREGKRSKEAGGGNFFFLEARPLPQGVVKPGRVQTTMPVASTQTTTQAAASTVDGSGASQGGSGTAQATAPAPLKDNYTSGEAVGAPVTFDLNGKPVTVQATAVMGQKGYAGIYKKPGAILGLEITGEGVPGGRMKLEEGVNFEGQLTPESVSQFAQQKATEALTKPKAEKAKATSKAKEAGNAAQEGKQQQGDQQQRQGTGGRVQEGGRKDRQRKAAKPEARSEDSRSGGAQESRQGSLDLDARRALDQDLETIDDFNAKANALLGAEGGGTYRAVRVPVGTLVGKMPGVGLIQKAASLFGKEVIFYRVAEGKDFLEGGVIRAGNKIFVNVNSAKPHIRIVGHELVHALKRSNSAAYDRLATALQPMLDEKGFADYAGWLESVGEKRADKILEEAIGDIVGDRFGESEFWQMMADRNPTGFKQFAREVINFIDNILKKIGVNTLGSETLVKDLKSARAEIARILSDVGQQTEAAAQDGLDPARSRRARDTAGIMEMSDADARKALGLNEKKNVVRKIGEALNEKTNSAGLTIERDDFSPEAVKALGDALYREVAYQLKTTSETGTGLGWYSNNYPKALRLLAKRFPELADNADARNIFTAIVAITSNGEKVALNVSNAIKIYKDFRQGKTMLESGASVGVRRGDALYSNLVELDELVAEHGLSKLREYLTTETTVSRMNKLLREAGKKPDGSYKANTKVPTAAIHFGPKLGAFYANLSGSEGYLTMDLWWTRTMNRMRGLLIPSATDSSIDTIRKIVGDMSLTKEQALDIAVKNAEIYDSNNFKTPLELFLGSKEPDTSVGKAAYFEMARAQTGDAFEEMLREHRLHKASNTVYKNEFLMLEEAPFNAGDREFMYKVAYHAQKRLKREGVDLSLADIQAAIWYYEKRLYQKLSGRKADDIGYEEALATQSSSGAGPEQRSVRFAGTTDSGQGPQGGVQDTVGVREEVPRGRRGRAKEGQVTQQTPPEGGVSVSDELSPSRVRETLQSEPSVEETGGTESAAFQKWFGESKITDGEGNPEVWYHGTARDIKAFVPKQAGAIFITKNPVFAESFSNMSADWVAKNYEQLLTPDQSAEVKRLADRIKDVDDRNQFIKEYTLDKLNSGENIIPVYVRAEKPFDFENSDNVKALRETEAGRDLYEEEVRIIEKGAWSMLERPQVQRAIRQAGFDSFYVIEGGTKNLAVYNPNQLKSIFNQGTWSDSDELSASRVRVAQAVSSAAVPGRFAQAVRDRIASAILPNGEQRFNWWHKSIGTQLEKARTNPYFRKVYDLGQKFLDDAAMFAMRAQAAAPTILPNLGNMGLRFWKGGISKANNELLGKMLAEGTLLNGPSPMNGKVWTDAELQSRYNATDEQIKLYREARAAIDQSLDDTTKALMGQLARSGGIPQSVINPLIEGQLTLTQMRDRLVTALGALPPSGKVQTAVSGVKKMVAQTEAMKKAGYSPLMRFGEFVVSVENAKGEIEYFSLHETAADALRTRNEISKQFKGPGFKISNPNARLNSARFKMFAGLSPSTLEAFFNAAPVTSKAEENLRQEYLQLVVSNRSALARMIQRKGTAGYNIDATRTLASFITSNARHSSKALNMAEMTRAITEIPQDQGDVANEAVKLMEYLQNPQEGVPGIRGFLFFNFLGGSVAAGLVNMTQPVLMTYPYLAQWGAAKAGGAMTAAMKNATAHLLKKSTGNAALDAALKKAAERGITQPQEMFQLMAAAESGTSSLLGHKFMRVWGLNFAVSEVFNRVVTFTAAFNLASGLSQAELQKAGVKDAYEFAVRTVEDTQGKYNKGNRPNWARETGVLGSAGTLMFTFKQYSIAYLEFLKQLYKNNGNGKKALGIALASLILAAGISGLPGADDLDDIIDTVGNWMGYPTNSKKWKTKFLTETLGMSTKSANFLLYGISSFLPMDLQARLGLANLIPGTGLLNPTKDNKAREVLDVLGPVGGFAASASEALEMAGKGNYRGAGLKLAPKAVKDAVMGVEMATTGKIKDEKGRVVQDATPTDALVKGIGFNPQSVASESRVQRMIQADIDIVKSKKEELHDMMARSIVDRDPELRAKAMEELRRWNSGDPEYRIMLDTKAIQERIKKMIIDRSQRFAQQAPKAMRARVMQELQQEKASRN